jgi:outer membrane immunogenic protein
VNVGAARGRFELEGPLGGTASRDGDWGFAGGGQIGCDYQFAGSGFVIGFRNMFDGTTNGRDRTFTVTGPGGLVSATGTADFHNRWFDALTGRIGYSWGPGLVYFQGGAVWSRIEADIALATTVAGVTTAFIEGNYYDFGSRDRVVATPVGTACQAGCLFSGNTTAVSVLAGVNYRFWTGM